MAESLDEYQNQKIQVVVEQIYKKYSKDIYYYLLRCTKDIETSRDLLQDTFIHFIEALKKGTEISENKIRIYIFTIAKNLFINYYRNFQKKQKKNQEISSVSESNPEIEFLQQLENSENEKLIYQILDRLEPEERNLIALRYTAEMSLEEISEIMNYSISKTSRKIKKVQEKMMEIYRKTFKE